MIFRDGLEANGDTTFSISDIDVAATEDGCGVCGCGQGNTENGATFAFAVASVTDPFGFGDGVCRFFDASGDSIEPNAADKAFAANRILHCAIDAEREDAV